MKTLHMCIGLVFTFTLAGPLQATAQTAAADAIPPIGTRVSVRLTDGRTLEGRIAGATSDTVLLGQERLSISTVWEVREIDPVRDGFAKGAVSVGLPIGLLAVMSCHHSTLGGSCRDAEEGKDWMAVIAVSTIGAGIGGVIGMLVDGAHTRIVYSSPTPRVSVGVTSGVGGKGRALALTVRW